MGKGWWRILCTAKDVLPHRTERPASSWGWLLPRMSPLGGCEPTVLCGWSATPRLEVTAARVAAGGVRGMGRGAAERRADRRYPRRRKDALRDAGGARAAARRRRGARARRGAARASQSAGRARDGRRGDRARPQVLERAAPARARRARCGRDVSASVRGAAAVPRPVPRARRAGGGAARRDPPCRRRRDLGQGAARRVRAGGVSRLALGDAVPQRRHRDPVRALRRRALRRRLRVRLRGGAARRRVPRARVRAARRRGGVGRARRDADVGVVRHRARRQAASLRTAAHDAHARRVDRRRALHARTGGCCRCARKDTATRRGSSRR